MSLLTHLDILDLISAGVIEGADPARVNAASLDVTLGAEILIEDLTRPRRVDLASKGTPAMRPLPGTDPAVRYYVHPGRDPHPQIEFSRDTGLPKPPRGAPTSRRGYLTDTPHAPTVADRPRALNPDGTPAEAPAGPEYILRPGDFALAHTREIFHLPDNLAIEYKLKSSLARAGLGHLLAGWGDPGWHGAALTLELVNHLQVHDLILRPGMPIGQVVFWRGRSVPAHASYAARGQYNGDTTVTPSKGLR